MWNASSTPFSGAGGTIVEGRVFCADGIQGFSPGARSYGLSRLLREKEDKSTRDVT